MGLASGDLQNTVNSEAEAGGQAAKLIAARCIAPLTELSKGKKWNEGATRRSNAIGTSVTNQSFNLNQSIHQSFISGEF